MNNGFSILELIIALALSLTILSIVITNVSETSMMSKKITSKQDVLESVFHTVDTIKTDLTKCGMRLQEASKYFNFPLFEHSEESFKVIYGIANEIFQTDYFKGEKILDINKNEYFRKGKTVLVYNIDNDVFEFNEIKELEKGKIILLKNLQNDYFKNSIIVVLKQINYKLYSKQNVLKRKTDKGYFQPLIENVTDFYIKLFPDSNSVLYRIEINNKEQIRGYIFLMNTV